MNETAPGWGYRNPACAKLIIQTDGTAPSWGHPDPAVTNFVIQMNGTASGWGIMSRIASDL
jgi:hypothetical protein